MIAFTRPLLDVMGEPRDIADLRSVFALANMCWNLPVFERESHTAAVALRTDFEALVQTAPERLTSALRGLLEARTTKFGELPFTVLVEVRGTSLSDTTIYAEAHIAAGDRGTTPTALRDPARSVRKPPGLG